jgi:hypothetical protein
MDFDKMVENQTTLDKMVYILQWCKERGKSERHTKVVLGAISDEDLTKLRIIAQQKDRSHNQ